MKKRRLKGLAFTVAAMFALTACGGESTTTVGEGTAPVGGTGSSVVVRIAYENHPGDPIDLAVNEWARLIEEESGGTMTVELFPSSQLGSKSDVIDQMLAGDSVITIADGAFYADLGVPDMGITFGPYLFDTWEQAWTLVDSEWWAEQQQELQQMGLKILTSNWMFGERHILSNRPIRTVDDLNGLLIRVPNNVIQAQGFAVLGASPTPMPLGETYIALQQGAVDAVENPIPVLVANRFYEVAPYLTLTSHVKNFTTWVTGTIFFDSLTPQQQQILIDTGNAAGIYNNQIQEAEAEAQLEYLVSQGVEVIEIDMGEFQDRARPFYELPVFTEIWSDNLYETVRRAMGAN